MDKGRPWDDLWWVFLHILSKVSVAVWIVFSAITTFAVSAVVYYETQTFILFPIVAFWFFIMSRIGLEWTRFYWNKILETEHKLTSTGGE